MSFRRPALLAALVATAPLFLGATPAPATPAAFHSAPSTPAPLKNAAPLKKAAPVGKATPKPGAKPAATPKPEVSTFFNGSTVERISLREALDMALRNNLEVKFEKAAVKLEQAKVRFEIGAFDPSFSMNMSHESLRRPENAADFTSTDQLRSADQATAFNNYGNAIRAQQGLPPLSISNTSSGFLETIFDQQNDRFSTSLIQRTPWGMRYGLFVEANRLRNTYSGNFRDVFPEYQTSTQIQLVQPLLKDFGLDANLANLRVAKLGKQVAILGWKQRLMNGIQGVMATYYDMIYALADVEVRKGAIRADNDLVRQSERRLELGFMQPFDVQQARAQVSVDEEALLSAKNVLMERQFALKRLILDEFNAADSRIFLPTHEPSLGVPELNRPLFLQQAMSNRPDFQQALLEAQAQDIRLKFARNQLLPQLDLVGTYGLNGLTGSYTSSFDQSYQGHTPGWTIGVNVHIALGNNQGHAQVQSATAQKEQTILKIKQSELGIGVDVDTVLSRIETNRQRVDTARKTRELFAEAVRIAFRRLDEGQISSFDIIEQQRRLHDAQSRELAAGAELNKSITQLWLVTGTVLEKAGIEIPDDRLLFPAKAR